MATYTVYYGSDSERNDPDHATSLKAAVKLARTGILSVIGGKAWARIERDGRTVKAYRYDEYGDLAGKVYEVNP